MVKNVETLAPGDTRTMDGRIWEVEAAEIQDGMMQVLWRSGDERRWDERAPGSPTAYSVVGAERIGGTVVVEWSNGVARRVREYDPFDGVLVDAVVETYSR